MKQEEKLLLLKDLSARLPYGVVIKTPQGDGYLNEVSLGIFGHELGVNIKATERTRFKLEECKPYLRTMSSMTEEEVKEFYDVECIDAKVAYIKPTWNWHFTINGIDWLIANHFDYRGLIPKGLAIEVTKENNPYEDINL